MNWTPVITAFGMLLGFAAAWGSMRKAIESLKEDLNGLKGLVMEVTSLKKQVEHLTEELSRVRESLDEARDMLSNLKTEVAVETAARVNAARLKKKGSR